MTPATGRPAGRRAGRLAEEQDSNNHLITISHTSSDVHGTHRHSTHAAVRIERTWSPRGLSSALRGREAWARATPGLSTF